MLLGENYHNFNEQHTSFGWASLCSKKSWLGQKKDGPWSYDIHVVTTLLCFIITLATYVAVFVMKKHLETLKAEGVMTITYNQEGVTISRRKPDNPTIFKLRNYNRTVVVPRASFLLFLLNVFNYILQAMMYYLDLATTIWGHSFVFFIPCRLFLFDILIATIFSPSLRNTLIDMFPWHRRTYHVVNV